LFSIDVFGQSIKNEIQITLESVVKDEEGNPIKGAKLYGNSMSVYAETDHLGKFSISIPKESGLLIEADGFEPHLYSSIEWNKLKEFRLNSSLGFYKDQNDINVAFKTTKRENIIGAVSVIHPEEIRKYDNDEMLSSVLRGRIPGLLGTSNIRGLGSNALFVVDGLPRDISTIKMSEVEQVSVLKDLNSSILYGNSGANGVILVTTKRGEANKQRINVTGYYGISTPKLLPKYLSSADYMELYNEARENDGLAVQYSEEQILNYRTGDKYRYPNTDYYSSDYLRGYSPFFNVETEFSGGNEFVVFYANSGWRQTNSYLNFGEGKNQRTNVFNLRGNIDIKVSSFLKSSIDAVAVLNEGYGPTGSSYWSVVNNFKPNEFTPLLPIDRIDAENELLITRKNDIYGQYLLGGTQSIRSNPIATVFSGGLISPHAHRTFSFNQKNKVDLGQLIEGFSFHTNMSFDFYSTYKQAVRYSYSVYEPVWDENNLIVDLKQYGTDTRTGTQSVGDANFIRRFGGYAMFDYNRVFKDVHHFAGSLLGYGSFHKNGLSDIQGTKNFNIGLRLNYIFDEKYMVDFSNSYNHSVKLAEGNRSAFSPSLGLAWVASSEDFLSSVDIIDYLKLRVSSGILQSDRGINQHYLYDGRSGNSGSYAWYEGQWSNTGTVSIQGENKNLFFETRKDLNMGFESLLFERLVGLDANFFYQIYDGQITRPRTMYPSFYSDFIPYENFDKTAFHGVDLGLTFNKQFGKMSVVFGLNALYTNSEVIQRDEIYRNEYQYRVGHPFDARFALVADGFFQDEAEIENHPIQAFGDVNPGDIKYVDQNDDGIIDAEDEVRVGRWQAPFSYGVHLKLDWENFTLFVLGNGQVGADSYKDGNYYWVDGNKKYSEVVLNRWTEDTKATATYPRLSSLSSNNNFRYSSFWLYQNDFLSIDRVQFTYRFPGDIVRTVRMKDLHIYIDGSNLFRLSKYRDIQDLNVNGTPYSRSFSLGVKMMF
ncbi:SusC/RagA family TonB-linked outer membrane protein, partial [Mariniphaga sediminis]|uniref:SusC/RagA family TonB-linked outer membrane protein n=1 Tax=Mariniphaga sediminis TaxID=1628158 RepID=UPI003568411B